MKSNGHSLDPVSHDVKHAEAMVDAILDAEVSPPTKVQDFKRSWGKNGKAFDFYKLVRWDEWWDEFATATLSNGRLKYKTAWSFAKAKGGKSTQKRELIYEMIGPSPENPKDKWRVPWLGDWQKRRANCFWALDDPAKVNGIKRALKERQDALDAALAIAPLSVQQLQRWVRLTEKIDEAFNGEPFLKQYSANHPQNVARFRAYMSMQKAAARQLEAASRLWLMAHGLNPSEPDKWLATAALAAGAGAAVGVRIGMGAGQPPNTISASPTESDLLLARSMRAKAQLFDLRLPEVIQGESKTKQ